MDINLYEVQGDSFIAKVNREEKRRGRMDIFFWVQLGIEIQVFFGVCHVFVLIWDGLQLFMIWGLWRAPPSAEGLMF